MTATVLRASRAVKYPFKQQTRCYASALKSPAAQRLTINSERLWHDIHHTAQWSAPNATTSAGGLSRLSGTIYDKHARDWFAAQVQSLGAKTYTVNSVGAQFATFSGENASLPPIAMGSHLDSVATGGRFDGPLGVLGALEVVRSFQEQGIKTHAPLAVINWTNEEGARFFPPLGSSVVYAGQSTVDSAHASLALNDSGETLGSALAEIGYIGSGPNTFTEFPISAHFEIHVEQQTSLGQANKPVGWVESWQGISVFKVTFQGEDGHANTYAMANRKDSLVAAANLITGLDALAAADPATRTTVTALHTSPTGTCNIQSLTTLTYCLMAPTTPLLASLAARADDLAHTIASRAGLGLTRERLMHLEPGRFDPAATDCVRRACGARGVAAETLTAHDSTMTRLVCPTGMVFARARDGVSHAAGEWTSQEDCAESVLVLGRAVLEFDEVLRARSSA